MIKSAEISKCGKYRYMLMRIWDLDLPKVCFVGLNPSTADAKEDDPTIRQLIEFAKSWNYGGFVIVNLFAMRATNPKDLYVTPHPVGAFNNQHIKDAADSCDKVVYCWGTSGGYNQRDQDVILLLNLDDAQCFGLTNGGHPKHPLYLHHTTKLETFKR